MRQYRFEDLRDVPANGIYVFFEENEDAHGGRRIVLIGTHKIEGGLLRRLKMHFSAGFDMSGSVFRKDVFEALLRRKAGGAEILAKWEIGGFDLAEEAAIAGEVTEYIRKKMSFVVFEIPDREGRLALEAKIIAAVSLCDECSASPDWLGKYSPKPEIAESGLWQVEGVFRRLTEADMAVLRKAAR
jgi:hypothetical protein